MQHHRAGGLRQHVDTHHALRASAPTSPGAIIRDLWRASQESGCRARVAPGHPRPTFPVAAQVMVIVLCRVIQRPSRLLRIVSV